MLNAFKMADEVLLQGVSGITNLITTPGPDQHRLRRREDDHDQRRLGAHGHRAGQRREPGRSPRPGPPSPARCSRRPSTAPAASCSTSPVRRDLGLFEVNEAAEIIHGVAHQDANIIFGTVIDDEMGDEVRVTVIAAGFDRWDAGAQPAPRPDEGERRRRLAPVKDLFAERATTTRSTRRRRLRRAVVPEVRSGPGGPRRGQRHLARRVAEGLAAVRRRIERAGGGPDVIVLPVTKGFGPEAIEAAVAAGCRASARTTRRSCWPSSPELSGRTARGALHRSAADQQGATLVGVVDVWETVDRPVLVARARRACAGRAGARAGQRDGRGRRRAGARPTDAPALVAAAREAGLDVEGLMTIGRAGPAGGSRAGFRELRALADDLGLRHCSMGMSDDLEVAVEEGATMVRVGTALFGERPPPRTPASSLGSRRPRCRCGETMNYLGLGPDDAYDDYDAADRAGARAAQPVADLGGLTRRIRTTACGPCPARPRADTDYGRPPAAEEASVTARPRGQGSAVRPVSGGPPKAPHTVRPLRFDQAQEVADTFKHGQPVIMNLQEVDRDLLRRLIDFASGLCYALERQARQGGLGRLPPHAGQRVGRRPPADGRAGLRLNLRRRAPLRFARLLLASLGNASGVVAVRRRAGAPVWQPCCRRRAPLRFARLLLASLGNASGVVAVRRRSRRTRSEVCVALPPLRFGWLLLALLRQCLGLRCGAPAEPTHRV